MRRLLSLIIALWCTAAIAVGSERVQSLEIDASSFAPVQTDVLSGVAIDKIGLDLSRRPCARIKMHINRMTHEEIEGLSVKPIGGNVIVMRRDVASEGNGLIIELTAKSPTRFYLHHDTFGDSNEVSLDLEGDKEYRLEARLDILLPIVVASNVKGAEVYLDNVFKGRVADNYMLTVKNVIPGHHTISLKYGTTSAEQVVDINTNNISFRVEIDRPNESYKIYKVGDYYNNGKKQGVVFKVSEDGRHGKIVSLTQSEYIFPWTSDIDERKRLIGADDKYHGAKNMAKVEQIPNWQSKYPAFAWCASLGEGWYLPALEELLAIYRSKEKLNAALANNGAEIAKWYWSSTESNDKWGGEFCAWYVGDGYTYDTYKSYNSYVRAVSAF